MPSNDHHYYLKRALFHRRQLELAHCPEARLCHAQLVKAYQRRLAEIRGRRVPSPELAPTAPASRATLALLGSGGATSDIIERC
ncbi:hypothetical protein [Sphingobium cloacae]|uniref:hypothetical protein n=1 Tax=Sphingobium cloacae TaxID=120107 RepID=UPI000F4D979F|nr:hypothetical protein [Sphingobium cloacae]